MQRVQQVLALHVPAFGAATFESVPVFLGKFHSLKTCEIVQKGIFGIGSSMTFPSCMYPSQTGNANVLQSMRYSNLQQLGSYRLLCCARPAFSQGRSLHVSVAFRQKPAMQRAAAWGARPPAGRTNRPVAPGAPWRRPPHKKRRGPVTERRSVPRSQFGAGASHSGFMHLCQIISRSLTTYTTCSAKSSPA